MIEITIRTEDEVLVQQLLQFIKKIGLGQPESKVASIDIAKKENNKHPSKKEKPLPVIQWAEQPEKAKEFFGIWKDNPIMLNQIRKASWGDRL